MLLGRQAGTNTQKYGLKQGPFVSTTRLTKQSRRGHSIPLHKHSAYDTPQYTSRFPQVAQLPEGRTMTEAVKPCMRFNRKKREYIVVSVGGSLIVPDAVDTSFLSQFRNLILSETQQGRSFFVIAGGGKLARRYQEAAQEVRGDLDREDLDWMGIHSTRLNAHLLRTIFKEDAQARIVKNPTRRLHARDHVVVGAGWKPGWSTDYCAVMAAKNLGATKLVNLSNIDYVYTADPRKDPTATKIEHISWGEFRKLIPTEWDPGLSSPFDPVAAREAEALGIEVAIINGAKLAEFKAYLADEPFAGTTIS